MSKAEETARNPWAIYEGHLADEIRKNPTRYGVTDKNVAADRARVVAGRFRQAAKEKGLGAVAIQTPSWKATAKELGVKPTYKDLGPVMEGAA